MNLEIIYESSPIWMQNLMCSIRGRQIVKERFNDLFFYYLSNLKSSQSLDADGIRRYKEENLYKILDYAYHNVPFYKTFYKERGLSPNDFKGLDDIRKFPILTKEIVRDNFKLMVSTSFPKERLVYGHTSGSSGKALEFFHTKEMVAYMWAIWWRFREQFGIHYGDKHLNCTGKTVVPLGSAKPPYWRINKPMNQWLVNMQHISNDKIAYIANMIEKEKFVYMSGYPSIIYSMALCMKDNGIIIQNPPKFVFSGAEKMYEHQKVVIEEVFPGIKCSDHYGMSEGVCNASKCKYDLYHEDYEFGHLECEDPHWISKFEYEGDILGTGFQNLGMPLIRYKIGDSAIWDTRPCKCGLHSQVIKDITGRSEDYVITPEGVRIQRFDYLFKDTKDIKECQVVQYELGKVSFRIVKRDSYCKKTEEIIREGVRRMISKTIKCEFEYVNHIERTNTGKFKAVLNLLGK